MVGVNIIARRLVEAYFGLSPDDRLSSTQKWVYSKLFNASERLLESFMERYNLTLDEAAGHLDKAEIERMAGISYAPAEAPVQASKVVKKEQTMHEAKDKKPRLQLTKEDLELFEKVDGAQQEELDLASYYALIVDSVSVLYPDGSYVKKGDSIVRKEIKEAVDGHQFDFQAVARGPDITDEGEVYWVSFEPEGLRVNADMAEEVRVIKPGR